MLIEAVIHPVSTQQSSSGRKFADSAMEWSCKRRRMHMLKSCMAASHNSYDEPVHAMRVLVQCLAVLAALHCTAQAVRAHRIAMTARVPHFIHRCFTCKLPLSSRARWTLTRKLIKPAQKDTASIPALRGCCSSSDRVRMSVASSDTHSAACSEAPGFELDRNHVRIRILLRALAGQLVHEVYEVHLVHCGRHGTL